MKKKIFISLLVIVSLFMITGCGSKKAKESDNSKKEEKEELGDCEKYIFDYVVDNDFYNHKEVRIASANTFWGFKLSGYNKVGGNLTKCYMFERRSGGTVDDYKKCNNVVYKVEEKGCDYMGGGKTSGTKEVFHSYDEGDDYYINVKAINKALKEYWEDMGY